MDLEHIDLDKYFENLFKVSENTLKLPLLYEQLERLSLIKYELTKRLVFDSTNSIYIDRTVKVSEEINKMTSNKLELENASISSDYVENFLLITPCDKQDIEFMRNNSFGCEQEEFNNKIAVSSLNEAEFINIYTPLLWGKISVYNKPFYETGNHILILKGIDKDRVKIDLANDLGIYDFIVYLKERFTQLNVKQKNKKVKQERTYDNVFKDKETRKMIEKCLIELRYIDNDKNWRLKGATQELSLFIDVMMSNCLHNDYFKKKSIASMMSQKYIGTEVVKYNKLTRITDERNIIDSIKYAIKKNINKI